MVRVSPATLLLAAITFVSPPVSAGLSDILKSTADGISDIFASLKPEENEQEVDKVVAEGNRALTQLVKQLSQWGSNAIQVAARKGIPLEKTVPCISFKRNLANGILNLKRQEVKTCTSATASLVSDVAKSFIQSNDPSTPTLDKPIAGCSESEPDCVEDPMKLSVKQGSYQMWGTRLSAVQHCVQDVVGETASDFTLIYRSLQRDCLPRVLFKQQQHDLTIIPMPPARVTSNAL